MNKRNGTRRENKKIRKREVKRGGESKGEGRREGRKKEREKETKRGRKKKEMLMEASTGQARVRPSTAVGRNINMVSQIKAPS